MVLNAELGRLIRDKAAIVLDRNKLTPKDASMTKYFCTEMANKVAYDSIHIHGGLGFMDDCPVSRYYRDIRGPTLTDGTSQIHQHIITRELGC